MASPRTTQQERDARNLDPRPDQKGEINLTNAGIDGRGAIIDVRDQSHVSVVLTEAIAASWTTGVVTIKRSIDRENWYALSTPQAASAPAEFWGLDVEDANYLALDVTTTAGASTRVRWNAKTYSVR